MTAPSTAAPRAATAPLLRVVLRETHYEALKLLRLPAFLLPSLAFPAMFYLLFGVALGDRGAGGAAGAGASEAGGFSLASYTLATMGTFGVIGAALFGVGAGVAAERGQGWLTVKRASPMPPAAYFAGKVLVSLLVALGIVLLLFALGATAGQVRLPPSTWAALALTLVVGAAPFCALGCAIAYLAGPNSAPAIVNLLYLPMAFASGLWMPLSMLPGAVRAVAPYLPPYHLVQLALGTLGPAGVPPGAAPTPALTHLLALAGYTVVFLALAVALFRRDEGKTYG